MPKQRLSFIDQKEGVFDYWCPPDETGDWGIDCRIGREQADELLRECAPVRLPVALSHIVEAIARKGRYQAIEIGFINRIGEMAAQGVARKSPVNDC